MLIILHRPHPEGEGAARCYDRSNKEAGIELNEVSYINAHGTSTPLNDKFETRCYKKSI